MAGMEVIKDTERAVACNELIMGRPLNGGKKIQDQDIILNDEKMFRLI